MIEKINIADKLSKFSDHWNPRVVGEINDAHVKLVKFQGPFHWHHHDHEDEMFLVVKGSFTMKFRDGDVDLHEGECLIVPKGVEHMPVAEKEVHIMLIEPKTTLNTGNIRNERTREELQRL